MSGKLPGAKQQFRIHFRPESLEQPSFSVSLCRPSVCPGCLSPSPLPSPSPPSRVSFNPRRSNQSDLVACPQVHVLSPFQVAVTLKMDKPRADSAPCLPAAKGANSIGFHSFLPILSHRSKFIRFFLFFFVFHHSSVAPIVACNMIIVITLRDATQSTGHSLPREGNDIIK
jgi:hypothetical protein